MSDLYRPFEEESKPVKQTRKAGGIKSFLSTITAGVIGSALTLGAVTYTDYFDFIKPQNDQQQTSTAAAAQAPTEEAAANIVQTSTADSASSIADIAENASKAIVGIVNIQEQTNPFSGEQGNQESGSGSGVIFKKMDGSAYIVTNNHVIEGASKVEVSLYDGQKATAEVVGADALTDLAVIKIDEKYASHTMEFGDSSKLRAGDQVIAIGNPLGLDLSRTVTQGIVSAVDRGIEVSTSAGEWELNVIQTDAAINPGNSGGALIDGNGNVVGINSLKITESGVEGLGFAIPSNDAVPIINELIETGQITRPYLGVNLADLEEIPGVYLQSLPEDVQSGTMVTYVDPNSAAAKAGLKQQDVIVSINGENVDHSSDLRKYMYSNMKTGDKAELKVYREGKAVTINVSLSSNSASS
ncbi:trypsin-like peptidase domain-containing protein [Mesobacillus foraminis]|uniref:S1C family serine protease n=1 Tax=Mesobacillus foraminis TaxID=279826 RepID=UPI001BE651BC|nr:trypsin-like peptidase domain-containing protein [Mesobacillus foraminis]MBT2758210.1 trypsin-like peptidase domain-containing protein [Mesobacillus foraminis]